MKRINDSERLSSYIMNHELSHYMHSNLQEISTLQSFEKNEHLIQSGEISDFLYFLVEGTVIVYSYATDTQNICINYASAMMPLGEASSLWGIEPKSSVKAATKCICICISLATYRNTLQQDVLFLQNTCRLLSTRLNTSITVANSLAESFDMRLAKFILENQKNDIFTFQLTTCAAILNVSYRHLLRIIMQFREKDILEKFGNSYIIRDLNALKNLANYDY